MKNLNFETIKKLVGTVLLMITQMLLQSVIAEMENQVDKEMR